MNQQDLARLAGISQQSLSKIERDIFTPTRDVRERLATILGVSPHELFPEETAAAS